MCVNGVCGVVTFYGFRDPYDGAGLPEKVKATVEIDVPGAGGNKFVYASPFSFSSWRICDLLAGLDTLIFQPLRLLLALLLGFRTSF